MITGRKTILIAVLAAFLTGIFALKIALAQQLEPILSDDQNKAVDQKYHQPDYSGSSAMSQPPAPGSGIKAPGNGVTTNSNGEMVLQGGVATLDAAMRAEKGKVDWYAWYLTTRKIINDNGGLDCATGTPVRFNRDGHVDALTFEGKCQISVVTLFCPLPTGTAYNSVLLPVRPRMYPPASPEELYDMIKQSDAPAW